MHFMHSDPVPLSFVTRSKTPAEAAALKHEASILARVAQPGVVKLGALTAQNRDVTLALVPLNGHLLSDVKLEVNNLAGVMTSLAMTVSRVHESGVTHNALDSSAVIISEKTGRPVLRNFASAKVTDEKAARIADVRALVALLDSKLSEIPPSHAPHAVRIRTRLEAIVDAATNATDAKVPTALGLAQLLRDATQRNNPAAADHKAEARKRLNSLRATLPGSNIVHGRHVFEKTMNLPTLALVAFAVTALSLGFIFLLLKTVLRPELPVVDPTRPQCNARPAASLVVDTDGDGCGDAVELTDASVRINGETFTVGNGGDKLALGRWTCTDQYTLGLLRPSTGQIYVFKTWPERGQDALPQAISQVDNATAIAAASFGNCDRIAVTTSGRTVTIDPTVQATPTTSALDNSKSSKKQK